MSFTSAPRTSLPPGSSRSDAGHSSRGSSHRGRWLNRSRAIHAAIGSAGPTVRVDGQERAR
jgi:hypothetical protein